MNGWGAGAQRKPNPGHCPNLSGPVALVGSRVRGVGLTPERAVEWFAPMASVRANRSPRLLRTGATNSWRWGLGLSSFDEGQPSSTRGPAKCCTSGVYAARSRSAGLTTRALRPATTWMEKHNDDVEWAVAGLSGLYCLQRLRSPVSSPHPCFSIAFTPTRSTINNNRRCMHGGNSRNAPILVRTRCWVDPWIWVNFLQKEEIQE